MLLNAYKSYQGRGRAYGDGPGKRKIVYLSLHCRHQNGSWIKMGSAESYFNVSLIVRDKVSRQCPQTTTLLKRKESRSGIEQRSFCLTARPNRLTSCNLNIESDYIT